MNLSTGLAAAIAVATLATAALIYGAGYHAGRGATANDELSAIGVELERQQQHASEFEQDRLQLAKLAAQLRTDLAEISRRKPVPVSCRLDDERLRLWNLATAGAAGEPHPSVPGPADPDPAGTGRGH